MTTLARLDAPALAGSLVSVTKGAAPPRRFLFLQGPISPFFAEVAAGLRELGHVTFRINLCAGDRIFWHGGEVTEFRGAPAEWPGFVADFMDDQGITDLVLLGEQRPRHREAIEAARARGIAVTVTDFGYLRPDWIVVERDGMGPSSRFPRTPEAIRALAATCPEPDFKQRFGEDFSTQAVWDVTFHLASLFSWRFRRYESWLLHPPIPAYLGTGLRLLLRRRATRQDRALVAGLAARGPLYLFAMQMENDFSIRAYSRFEDNDTAIAEVVQSFARSAPAEAHLLVKVHPLDPGLKAWGRRIRRIAREAGVAGRVHYLPGALPMDEVIRACRGVVTINSTLGVRAIALGRAVRVLGQALYDIPGLTWQGGADAFWQEAPPPEPDLARDFLKAIAACLHVRGGYYARPGLDAAVAATVRRLHMDAVNVPLPGGVPPAG
ncbi:capsular biosynthesis protein [Siccirubricoccus sp. KC 17139]|uniref:Capsular biosynthesis protein n=1 Tax=Siccirubricoccus soli TaxID=2899147 RepID=A0ABT1DD44_9PROT|nr:capsular biosynthesis protein [Siccirubricoccus soli]MCO6419855.1 capsular biosynthesis protein [Siccirubricoccus soli]MCP2685990.1 capsular biosynthesis protein [Siccirubricoccus soli]